MFTMLIAGALAAAQTTAPQAQPETPFDHKTMDHSKMDHSKMAHGDGCCCCHDGNGANGCKKPADDKSAEPQHSSH